MKKTTSWIPLILGIIGGVIGIVQGCCISICGEVNSAVGGSNNLMIGGYLLLASSIIGLIGGCIARVKGIGLGMMLLATVASIVGLVLVGFDILILVSVILFAVGGILGFLKHD